MLKKLLCKVTLLFLILILCGLAGCARKYSYPEPAKEVEIHETEALIRPELLKAANLKIAWSNVVPLKKGEFLERLFIGGDRVYVLTNHNYMVSMDRIKRVPVFSRHIAPAGFVVLDMNLYQNELLTVISNNLVGLERQYCTEGTSARLSFTAILPPVRNSMYYYLAAADKRVHVLQAERKIQVFEAASEDEGEITSVIADDDLVIFATSNGSVIHMRPERAAQVWSFQAARGVNGPVVRDADELYFSSQDAYIYKVSSRDGELIWKYQTSALLEEAPIVTEKILYQYVEGKGLIALNKENKELIWELPNGLSLLAENANKAYVFTETGDLVVMDNKKRKQLYSVNFENVSLYVSNLADSRIYIADKLGRIACLEPAE